MSTNLISSSNIFTAEDSEGEFIVYHDKESTPKTLSSLRKNIALNTYDENSIDGFKYTGIPFDFQQFYASKDKRITAIGISKNNAPKWLGKIDRTQFKEELEGYYLEDLELKSPTFDNFTTSLDQIIEQQYGATTTGNIYGIKRGGDRIYRIQYEVNSTSATTIYQSVADSANDLNGTIVSPVDTSTME